MARRFVGTGQVRYIGAPYTRPVPICKTPDGKPLNTAVPLQFDWTAYGASSINSTINVLCSLATPDVKQSLLSRIASVYIDNTNSQTPIYVYAPDTQYIATAQPNSAGWYPLYTNGFDIWVIGIGFITGQIPFTTIFVSDLFVPPYTDQELAQSVALGKASAQIQRGQTIYNSTYAAFALGDQFVQASLAINPSGGSVGPIFPVLGSGFYIITSLVVSADISAPFQQNASNAAQIFESTGVSGQFMVQSASLPTSSDRGTTSVVEGGFLSAMIFQSGLVQWKISATEFWRIRDISTPLASGGNLRWNFTYTSNPT